MGRRLSADPIAFETFDRHCPQHTSSRFSEAELARRSPSAAQFADENVRRRTRLGLNHQETPS